MIIFHENEKDYERIKMILGTLKQKQMN